MDILKEKSCSVGRLWTLTVSLHIHFGKLKVLQYFDNINHISTASDDFDQVVKVTNNPGQWDAGLAWYSLLHGFTTRGSCFIVKVLVMQVKLLPLSGYFIVIHCTITVWSTNIFAYFNAQVSFMVSSNTISLNPWIRQLWMFICGIFKTYVNWSSASTDYGFNCFSHVIFAPYQNKKKRLLTHSRT